MTGPTIVIIAGIGCPPVQIRIVEAHLALDDLLRSLIGVVSSPARRVDQPPEAGWWSEWSL